MTERAPNGARFSYVWGDWFCTVCTQAGDRGCTERTGVNLGDLGVLGRENPGCFIWWKLGVKIWGEFSRSVLVGSGHDVLGAAG